VSEWQETEFGLIPDTWAIKTVGQLVEENILEKPLDGNHGEIHPKGTDFVSSGIPFVMATDVINGKVDLVNCKFISIEQANSLSKGFSITGDVLLTHKASLGRTAIVGQLKTPYIMLTPQVTYYRVKNFDKLNNKFLKHFFNSPVFQDTLVNHGDSGSTRAYIGITAQRDLPVILPKIEEQKAIASVLSSLEDKIDLLHRQNTTLERMAETLFRQLFVEEAQEDWEEVTLEDVATVQNGYAFSSGDYVEYQEGFLEVFKMGHIQPGGGLRFNPKADFVPRAEKLKRWTLNKNDIVMAMTDMKDNMGILGHPALIDVSNKYALNQRVARIYLEPTGKLKSIYLLYLQLNTEEAISLLQSKANSGVQVNLTTEAIKSIPVSLPPESVQDKVLSNIEPIFDKLSSNRLAVKTLEKLRDNLLPKLMSAEVRVI